MPGHRGENQEAHAPGSPAARSAARVRSTAGIPISCLGLSADSDLRGEGGRGLWSLPSSRVGGRVRAASPPGSPSLHSDRAHLRLQEAAVGGVGCASPLALLAFALDLCKTHAVATGPLLPRRLCLRSIHAHCSPEQVGSPGLPASEAGQVCWAQVGGRVGRKVTVPRSQVPTLSSVSPWASSPSPGHLSWVPQDDRCPLVRCWPGRAAE